MGRVKLQWKWYDLWMGLYIDTSGKVLYICPLPTIVLRICYGAITTLSEIADPADIDSPLDVPEREHIEQGMMDEAAKRYAARADVSIEKANKTVAEYLEARVNALNKALEDGNGKTKV